MRAVVQRVSRASVSVAGDVVGAIGPGMLVFLGISTEDANEDADYLAKKITGLRIFEDKAGKMNASLTETSGSVLVVSQFTLYGDVRKGRRPSFIRAARPEVALEIYNYFVDSLRESVAKVESGEFQAMMDVELVNDGPVTILIDSAREF